MRKRYKGLLTLLFSFLLLSFPNSSASAESTFLSQIPAVPDGSVTIDGSPSDWSGIQPVVSDSPSDSVCGSGTDIKDYYLAKDSNYLYWRVDTSDGTFSLGTSADSRVLNLLFYELTAPNGPWVNGLSVNIGDPYNSGYISARYDNQNWINLYGGSEYTALDAVAEGKIPLAEFAPFNIEYISASFERPSSGPSCDGASRYFQSPPPPPNPLLNATKIGTGTGSVVANAGAITWNGNIGTATYNSGDTVILAANPDPGSIFSGWSGEGCSGTGFCNLTMNGEKVVRAIFTTEAFAAWASAAFKSQIPTTAQPITIDGTPSGWDGILPMISDSPTDSSCGSGTDIKDFYLAMDSNYLYWRVDTSDGTFSSGTPADPRVLNLLFYELTAPNGPWVNGLSVNIGDPYYSGYISARYDNQNWINLYGGSGYTAHEAVAEGKIPLAEFAPFNIEYISASYEQPSRGAACDGASRFFQNIPPAMPIAIRGGVGDFQGRPISGARVEQAENQNIFTTSASNGSFTISGLPIGTPFSLKISKEGYVTEYSENRTFNTNPQTTFQFGLANYAEASAWNIDLGRSAIMGVVFDNNTISNQPLAGAVVTCISSLHQDVCPYPIMYANNGTSTSPNGKYLIRNVDPGDTVIVSASKPGIDFGSRTFLIHADGVSFGRIFQTSPRDPTLSVNKSGTGAGSISASIGTISWNGNAGTASYNSGTVLTLTATPDTGSIFSAWAGGCDISSGNRCIIMKTDATSVTATFTDVTAPSITPSTLPGQITTSQLITLSSNEAATIYYTLDGSDPTNSSLVYTDPISIVTTTTIKYFAVDRAGNAGPVIALPYIMTYALTVQESGSGEGIVTSTDGLINCGSSCTASYAAGKPVTLAAAALTGANSMFVRWSGACTGTGNCTLTMDANKNVTAEFCKNLPPILDPIGDKSVNEEELLQFTISATDPEGNALTYSASHLPSGATFDPPTQTFTWRPSFDQAGVYSNAEFTVTDNGNPIGVDSQLITIAVGNVNRPPVFTPIGPIQAIEGELSQFTIDATDPDGDSIAYFTEPLPAGASFDPATRIFSWTPDYTQARTYTIVFFASDNGSPENKTGRTEVVISASVPPPSVLINQTVDTVYALQLPKEVENSYIANLKKVGIFIKDGKVTPAVNQLNATIKKIYKDMAKGDVSKTNGDRLIMMITLLSNELNS